MLSDNEIKEVYEWVDEFELSKIKKNIGRDFCDGVLVAEILHEFYPEIVWLHCYNSVNS